MSDYDLGDIVAQFLPYSEPQNVAEYIASQSSYMSKPHRYYPGRFNTFYKLNPDGTKSEICSLPHGHSFNTNC